MTGALRIVGLEELRPRLDRARVLDAVRHALVRQAEGHVQSPLPGQLRFENANGDCHIKSGYVEGGDVFAVKVATGFYDNPKRGLPVNHGLVLVFDAGTGAPSFLLMDDGWLTAWRTAAACALAACSLAPREITRIGIIGTGLQASLAVEWISETIPGASFAIWGRDHGKAQALARSGALAGFDVRVLRNLEELLSVCNIIVTATPSTKALFSGNLVRPGCHYVGLGADSPGKQELPVEVFARAAHILVDDIAQCLDHGDFGNAVRASAVPANGAIPLGDILSGKTRRDRAESDISVVDLTGIAAEDIAIAQVFGATLEK